MDINLQIFRRVLPPTWTLGGKIMSLDLNLDPGPSGGNTEKVPPITGDVTAAKVTLLKEALRGGVNKREG